MRVIESNIQPLQFTLHKKIARDGISKCQLLIEILSCAYSQIPSSNIRGGSKHASDMIPLCATSAWLCACVHHQRARALDARGLLMNHYNNTDGSVCSNDTWMCFLNAELVLRANHMHLCSSRRPRASARDGKTRKLKDSNTKRPV